MSDREELLKAVAECWPQDSDFTVTIGARGASVASVVFWPKTRSAGYILVFDDDIQSAPACFLMLNEMEKAGYPCCFGRWLVDDDFCIDGEESVWGRLRDANGDLPFGKTRAEAITRAFVACFKSATQTAEGDSLPASTGEAEGEK